MMPDGEKLMRFINDQRCGWSQIKEAVEALSQTCRMVLPIRQMVGADLDSQRLHFIQNPPSDPPGLRFSCMLWMEQNDAAVSQLDQLSNCRPVGWKLVRPHPGYR